MTLLGFRYAWRDRGRFALTAAGIAAAIVLTLFLVGVYRGATRGSLSYIEGSDADLWVGRRGTWNLLRAGGLLPVETADAIRAIPDVRRVEPILGALLPASLPDGRRTLLVIGLAPDAALARPRAIVSGVSIPGPGEIVLDRAFARRAGLGLGDGVEIAGRRFRIAGTSRDTNLLVTQYAFLLREDLESLVGVKGQATFLLVRAAPGRAGAALDQVRRLDAPLAAFDREAFLENNRREIASGFLPVLGAVALLGLLVGAAVVALMTYAAVLERRADFALMGALGGDEGTRFLVVMQQSLAAAVVGSAAGLLVLWGIARVLPAAVPEVELDLSAGVAVVAIVGSLAMAAMGAFVPAAMAVGVPPMEALRR